MVNETVRTAVLRAHPKAVYESLTISGSLAITALVPGMLLKAVVDKIVEVCLCMCVTVGSSSPPSCRMYVLEWPRGELPRSVLWVHRHLFPAQTLQRRRVEGIGRYWGHPECEDSVGGPGLEEHPPVPSPTRAADESPSASICPR